MRLAKVLVALLPVAVHATLPLSRQHPLIARVDQPYSWTISRSTFDDANFSTIFLRGSPDWLTYDNVTSTFRGTPTSMDIGVSTVRVHNQFGESDRFQLYVSDLPPPIINIPLESQLVPGNPSISSGFTFSAPSIGVRVPPKWSFSIGFDGFTFTTPDGRNVYYDATLADGLPLPGWIVFNNRTLTFDGVAPPMNRSPKLSIILHGSDRWGFGAIQAQFDLVVGPRTHLLGVNGTAGLETINVTGGTPFAHSIKTFGGLTIDGVPVVAANISRVEVNLSSVPWVVFDNSTRVLSGLPPLSAIGRTDFVFPVSITSDYNDTADTSMSLAVFPSYFNSMAIRPVAVTTGTFLTFSLLEYITSGRSTLATIVPEYIPRAASSWLSYDDSNSTLSGIVPKSAGYNEVNVTFSATNLETRAISTTSLVLSISPNVTFEPEVWEHRHERGVNHRAKMAILVTFSVIGGAILLCCLLALCRRYCAVRDPIEDDENASQWRGRDASQLRTLYVDPVEKSMRSVELGRESDETTITSEGACKTSFSAVVLPRSYGANPEDKSTNCKGIFQRLLAASKRKLEDQSLGSQSSKIRRSQISRPTLIGDKHTLELTADVLLEGEPRSDDTDKSFVQRGKQYSSGVSNSAPSSEWSRTEPDTHGGSLPLENLTQTMGGHNSQALTESDESSLTSIPRRRSDFLPPRDQRMDGPEQPRPSAVRPARSIPPSGSSGTISNDTREAAVIATAARQVLPSVVSTTSVERSVVRSSVDSTNSQTPNKNRSSPSSPGSLSITGVRRPRLVQLNSEKRVLASSEGASTSRNRSQKAVISSCSRASANSNESNETDQDKRLSLGIRYVPSLGDDDTDTGSAVFYMTPSVGVVPSPVVGLGKAPALFSQRVGSSEVGTSSLSPNVNNSTPVRTSRHSTISIGTPFAISVPFESIPARGAEISVRQQNGKPVPAWVNLDQRDVELWGVPLKEHLGTHLLEILEVMEGGQRVVARMSLEVVQCE
ncbi:unnamed protein product [Rhizoctonia solani]|uniref:Dystroglycan-type cadherin-like domain-containing protein n=1 Tax=Rhizoctonia solani TaxID=456999 RepID=A0A8H3GVT8_9AGAM|nr:unnamed protein product [Rhizoctonia solani]